MKRHPSKSLAVTCLAALWHVSSAQAVIVGGTNGDGLNNADNTTLQNYLSSVSVAAFPYWNNLIRYSDASSIYLGYNPLTMQGWVLSANHITETTGITIGGHHYTFIDPLPANLGQNGTLITSGPVNTDLVLYKFSVGGLNPIPTLPTVPLLSSAVQLGDSLIMAGRGMRLGAGTVGEDTVAPYSWGTPGTSDSVPFRWGSNIVGAVNFVDPNNTVNFRTNFNQPGQSTAYDGQAALGDSGGSGFVLRDGQWWLAGVMVGVDDGPDSEATASPAGYLDITNFNDVAFYRTEIQGITGALIPEPSSLLLISPALLLLLRRRRCEAED